MKVYEYSLPAPEVFKRDIIVRVAVPEGVYRTIPMLIMHDGQNFFDVWDRPEKKTEALDMLDIMFEEGLPPFALVGIDTWEFRTHFDRFTDFSPWNSKDLFKYIPTYTDVVVDSAGGRGDQYADFVCNEIIPFVEGAHNIGGSPEMRGIAGQSMGAMATIYIGTKYNELFTKFGLLSPALWCFKEEFKSYMADIKPFKKGDRIYMDMGRQESSDPEYEDFPREYLCLLQEVFPATVTKCLFQLLGIISNFKKRSLDLFCIESD